MAEDTNFDDKQKVNNDSPNADSSQSSMLKPWMKVLPKKYWDNAEIGRYDSFEQYVDASAAKPEKKTLPEKYGIRDGFEDAFRKANLTMEEAKALDEGYSKLIPEKKPELKDVFGDTYDKTIDRYSKGVESIASDLKDEIAKAGLDKDPTFVKIMSIVGKETGGKPFVANPKNEPKPREGFEQMIRKAHNI